MKEQLGENGAFVLGPGRCGSTMLSDILNLHPQILSLSEFLSGLGARSLLPGKIRGAAYWKILSTATRAMRRIQTAETARREFLYPHVNGRFPITNVPPLLGVTLPHLSDDPDSLFDELAKTVPHQPRQTVEAHHSALFERLMELCGGRIWVERSGGSLTHARVLPRLFPLAKFVLLCRDGRDVTLSLQAYRPAWPFLWMCIWARKLGVNPFDLDHCRGRSRRLAFSEEVFVRILPVGWMLRTVPPLKECAAFWSEFTLTALPGFQRLSPDRRHVLHFERLTAEPRKEITDLMAFLDVEVATDWLEEAARIPKQLPPRWKQLAPDEQRALSVWTEEARMAVDAQL